MADQQPGLGCDDLDFSDRIRFREVLRAEYGEINTRRAAAKQTADSEPNGRPRNLFGLALSGGGIRSATFNLGVLQALAAAGKLKVFDYLSTVSGGGYTGGWWSAYLARPERDQDGRVFPPDESIIVERDDLRAQLESDMEEEHDRGTDRAQVKDSALTASNDPIHHLRLFSNFLTPKKGILSGDTWRAITTTVRNIVLTQLVLIPILLAAIMIGQMWFILPIGAEDSIASRLLLALAIPALLLVGNFAAVSVWLIATRRLETWGDKVVVTLGGVAFVTLTALALSALDVPRLVVLAIAALIGLWMVYVFWRLFGWRIKGHTSENTDRTVADYWRNRLVLLQTRTLAYSVLAAVVLLFAGFGHVLVEFLIGRTATALSKAGSWSTLAVSIATTLYTIYKAWPTGGADVKTGEKKPHLISRIALKIAPGLFLLVMGIFLSWVGHRLFVFVRAQPWRIENVTRGAIVAAFLFLIFAIYEFRPRQRWKTLIPLAVLWIGFLVGALTWPYVQTNVRTLSVIVLFLLSAILVIRAAVRRRLWIIGYAILLAAIALWFILAPADAVAFDKDVLKFMVAGVLSALVLLVLELAAGRGANTRCIALAVIGCGIFVVIGAAGAMSGNVGRDALTILALIAMILGWVLSLGWLADPNSLTLHAFYKSRLVRAYLGASNARRAAAKESDITDAVPGDDVLLTNLRNTERGAPYHLVNTMLNLVGGGDIATQARASELFLMSKNYCGSVRTGFRRTSEYACGTISLGTAVAVSGAAASPTMGALTPSAAQSALMTLFNVRTGYWAPTPNLSYWRSGSTRLWPVYTLQELVSQTTDLLPYCYLTDGGHYENSGVYPLIERGCKLIVVGECGADPKTMLDDLGNLLRKVRIDFGTEIELDIDQLRPEAKVHVVVGKIRYGTKHADALGLTPAEREGTLVVIKPNLAGGEPVDVRTYGFANPEFPQQQTFDLFYDEAQFESYRRLGQLSGELAVATGKF